MDVQRDVFISDIEVFLSKSEARALESEFLIKIYAHTVAFGNLYFILNILVHTTRSKTRFFIRI